MKKLSVHWLCLFLLLSIFFSEYIATSIDFSEDQLNALLNVFLPACFGLTSIAFVVLILLTAKQLVVRKTAIVVFICANLIYGSALNIHYLLKGKTNIKYTSLNGRQPASDFHLITNTVGGVNKQGITKLNQLAEENDLFFSRLSSKGRQIVNQNPKRKSTIKDHDHVSVIIDNDSDEALIITKAAFLKGGMWEISKINGLDVDDTVFPIVVGSRQKADITLAFTAGAIETKVKKFGWNILFKSQLSLLHMVKQLNYQPNFLSSCMQVNDRLTLYSNSRVVREIDLHGLWQYRAEGDWEPDLQKILTNLNFRTNVGFKYFDNHANGEFVIPNSDEIAVAYFLRADDRFGVKITQLAAYHAFNSLKEDDELKCFFKDQSHVEKLFKNEPGAAQSILPKMLVGANADFNSFYPINAFGFVIGTSYTDRAKNFKKKLGIRVWKALDFRGDQIADTYILGCDFIGQARTNYDYQDNVYLVQNVKPFADNQSKLIAKK